MSGGDRRRRLAPQARSGAILSDPRLLSAATALVEASRDQDVPMSSIDRSS
jgi:hypothetical protein